MSEIDFSITIDDYHKHQAVSRSVLGLAGNAKTAAHFHVAMNKPKDSEALRFGNAFHKFVLEPELYEKFAVEWSETATCGVKFKKAEAELDEGYFLVPVAWLDKIKLMAQSIKNHPKAHKLLSMNGDIEPSFFWHDERFDIDCKCRPDFLTKSFVVDLKKTENKLKSASADDFYRHIIDFNYDIQAYMNISGVNKVADRSVEGFVFIVVEDDEPYGVNVFLAGESVLESGRIKYEAYMNKYLDYKNSIDCYPSEITTIELPDWHMNRILIGEV